MFAIASRLIDDSFATQFDISFASEVKTIAPLNLFWTEKMMEAPVVGNFIKDEEGDLQSWIKGKYKTQFKFQQTLVTAQILEKRKKGEGGELNWAIGPSQKGGLQGVIHSVSLR
jgi:hypothetical protein